MVLSARRLQQVKIGMRVASWTGILCWLALGVLGGRPAAAVPPVAQILVGLRIIGFSMVLVILALGIVAGPGQVFRKDFWQ
jgi:hypothetical protein